MSDLPRQPRPLVGAAKGGRAAPQPARPLRPVGPAATTASQIASEAQKLKAQIEQKLAVFEKQDHFAILGLQRNATKEQVKAAYNALARIFHPDRLARFQLGALAPGVGTIFARLSEAQAILTNDARRAEYLDRLEAARTGSARGADQARQLMEAEAAFRKGEAALRQGQIALAEEQFRRSTELNPEEGEHHALLAWAIYQADRSQVEAVKRKLQSAITLAPKNPRPLAVIGEVFLCEGEIDRAITAFRRALELREGYAEAQRGLRLALMRKEKAPAEAKSGRWLGWFRKS
jgi:curved DNA-binding protein CbpA